MSWRHFYSVVLLVILASQVVLARKGGNGKCQVCQSFVDSFKAGLKNTENSHFAGGDTSWEEKKNQPVYADSEVRLIEILESICGSTDYGCTRFMDNNEEDIEKWWLKLRRNGHDDFEKWLCFDHLKVCCPKGTYGPDCIDCPGGSASPCSGHGTCQGSGEIDGIGVCKCDDGYKGSLCDECKEGYYYEEDNCKSCDKSCKNGCTGSGPQQCVECADGYTREETQDNDDDNNMKECEDIDECEDEIAKCKDGTYCHNTPGSYDCKDCDKSCKDVCTSRGPSGCVECGHGYEDKSGYCMDINECTEGKSDCKEGRYCENNPGSYKCEGCDESCLLTCTKSGPSGCDLCKEGYTMKDDACEDLDECASYPLPCDEESEFCSNLKGSFACKCKSGYTRVEGKCTTWQKAEEIREQKSEKKTKKKKKKSGKKQPAVTLEQDQSNSDLSPENGDQDGSINQDYIPSTDRDDTPFNDINDIPPTVSAGHNEL